MVRFGRYRLRTPASRSLRIGLGILLVLLGFLGFLPVLGFWMIPLGLLVLSVDLPFVRRARRRFEVWLGRRGPNARNKKGAPGRTPRKGAAD